jgi:PAS domain S-box-containing protein
MSDVVARILHLEDQDDDAYFVENALREASILGEFRRVTGLEAYREALLEFRPDVILADYQLPDIDGVQALELGRRLRPGTPFIFVTGYLEESVAAATLEEGVTDYVLKDRLTRLPSAVRRAIRDSEERRTLIDAQAALIQSEERHRAVSEVTSDFAYSLGLSKDGAWSVEWMTGAFEAVTGYPDDDLSVESLRNLVNPEDLEQVTADFRRVVAGELQCHEVRIVTRTGQERWICNYARQVLRADGSVLRVYGAAQDITELHRSADTLAEATDALQALVSSAPVAVMTLDTEGIVTRWNPAAERIFGWTESEALGLPYPVKSPDTDEIEANRHRVIQGGEVEPYEAVRFHKDGSPLNVLINMCALRGPDGKVNGLLGILVDVTGARRAEDALRRSEKMAAEIVTTALEGIVVTDATGMILEFNPAAEKIFGYTRVSLVGTNIAQLVPPDKRERHAAGMVQVAKGHHHRILEQRVELTGMRADGTIFPVELEITRLGDAADPVYAAHVRDLTESRRAETEQLHTEEDLRQSVAALQRSDDERRRLLDRMFAVQEEERHRIAGDIHDDSVQVMAAAALRLDMLRQKLEDPEHLVMIDRVTTTVRTSIDRLRRLMFELRPPALDREGLANAVQTYLEQLEGESELTTELQDLLTEEPPEQVRLVLYRVVQEALTNARKHGEAKHVMVRLEESEGSVVATITDDGCGFEMGDLESPAGHLGISSMRERTTQAGGQISLRTAPGEGTTVEARLPVPAAVEIPVPAA